MFSLSSNPLPCVSDTLSDAELIDNFNSNMTATRSMKHNKLIQSPYVIMVEVAGSRGEITFIT